MAAIAAREHARTSWAVAAALFGLVVAAGILLRFENLGGKVFWQDEAYTALHATGHLDRGDLRPLFDGRIRTAGELRRLQRLDPHRGAGAAIAAIAAEDSDQGALYYLLERVAIQADGGSIVSFRVAGAVLGVLSIAAGFGLAWELFGSLGTAAIFAAILALSPFEVLYAHEARSYTLTVLMTLVTSHVFLRAVRARTAAGWALYGIAMAAGLYASLLLAIVAASHWCYSLLRRKDQGRAYLWCLGALALSLLLYAPWIAVLAAHRGMVNTELDWGGTPYPLRLMAVKWLYNASAQFFDLEWLSLAFAPVGALFLCLTAASLYVARKYAAPAQWQFIAVMAVLPAALFIGRDAVEHAHWSTIARYLIPTWLALQLAVAFTLWRLCAPKEGRGTIAAAGAGTLAAVLLLEGVSSAINTRAASWYNDQNSAATPPIAAAVNASPHPLLIGEKAWAFFLDASNYLRPDVHLELFADARHATIVTGGYSDVFVPTPSAALAQALARQGYTLRQVYAYTGNAAPYAAFHRDLQKNGPKKLPVNASVSFPDYLYSAERPGTQRSK